MIRIGVAKNPNSVTAHSNLGSALQKKGSVDEAIVEFQRSLEIDPGYQFGRYNLGAALLQKGEPDKAIPHLRASGNGAIVNNGGQESQCGWCKDKWGVSWQITPRVLTEALAAGGDEAKRAFDAMMGMKKIDVAAIEAARRGSKVKAGWT